MVLFDGTSPDPFRRFSAGQISRREWLPNFLSLLTVIVPFGTLVFLNGGIVLMLRQQNVQVLLGNVGSTNRCVFPATPLANHGTDNGA